MELEKQVCSLELAKKLKELGVKQGSYFWWSDPEGYNDWQPRILSSHIITENEKCKLYSAFTVAELGEMLPIHILTENSGQESNNWICSNNKTFSLANTEADAKAEMYIYLLANKIIN